MKKKKKEKEMEKRKEASKVYAPRTRTGIRNREAIKPKKSGFSTPETRQQLKKKWENELGIDTF